MNSGAARVHRLAACARRGARIAVAEAHLPAVEVEQSIADRATRAASRPAVTS
jgi:hypothetical protein